MHKPGFVPRQQPETASNPGPDAETSADSKVLPPLKAIYNNCLECRNGKAQEVRLCPAKSCPLWGYRYGRNPTAEIIAEQGDEGRLMYPLEDGMTVLDFYSEGGTRVKAIERYCLDCSGHSISGVKNCQFVKCHLYPFRRGKNPNRKTSPEQRKIKAARLKANIARSRRDRK